MANTPPDGAPRVVLVNPPPLVGRTNDRTLSGGLGVSRKLKPFERERVAVPPIDVLYLAAVAERAGASVAIVDLLLERISGRAAERWCVHALGPPGGPPPWIGIRISMPSLLQDLGFADRLKAAAPDAIVFLFGAAIMVTIDQWIRATAVDYVLYGEPEAFFPEALAAADPRAVPGVIAPAAYVPLEGADRYDEAKNSARYAHWITVARPSSLPLPAWHLLDLRRYADGAAPAEIGVQVQASRGCPFACTMCPYMLIEGTAWRKHDVDEVVDQLEHLNRTYGIHRVRFRDANFGISRQFAGVLAEAIIARGIRLDATIETSIEVFDEPTLRRLFEAGVRTITTGVETNDAACMASIGQKIKVNTRLQERIALCHTIGYRLYGTYCLGMPEETWDTVEGTWRFANALDIESGFTVLTPFPGTPMYWRAIAEGLLTPGMQFSAWNSYTATVRTYALSTTDLNMARWWARMETILPFRRTRAAAGGRSALLRFYLTHVPHHAWRQACRLYVWWRRRWPAPPAGLCRTVPTAAA
jgi:anaerobic magnesium-protoporphyrin IX monomethyl ester cyclase